MSTPRDLLLDRPPTQLRHEGTKLRVGTKWRAEPQVRHCLDMAEDPPFAPRRRYSYGRRQLGDCHGAQRVSGVGDWARRWTPDQRGGREHNRAWERCVAQRVPGPQSARSAWRVGSWSCRARSLRFSSPSSREAGPSGHARGGAGRQCGGKPLHYVTASMGRAGCRPARNSVAGRHKTPSITRRSSPRYRSNGRDSG